MDKINCTVKIDKMGYLTITFENGKSIYLQSDYERAQFGVACGIIKAPENWSGVPHHLIGDWWVEDFESITECPDYYINSAE